MFFNSNNNRGGLYYIRTLTEFKGVVFILSCCIKKINTDSITLSANFIIFNVIEALN